MKDEKVKIDFAVGGQALLEGVLMRSPNFNVMSVRNPAGSISQKTEFYQNLIHRIKILNIPLLRGVINMIEMMIIGTKALNYSSQTAMGLEQEEGKENRFWASFSIIFSIVFGLGLALVLFKFVPLWLTNFLSQYSPLLSENYLLYNLVDGLLKTSIFVGYIALMALIPDIKRVFMYHGAEHKSIMTYEHGLPLDVENARKQTRFHPRCGTSFILLVFVISILVFTLLPKNPDFIANFSLRVLALPLIAGISYEILKYSAKHTSNPLFRMVAAPGLLMQRLTTSEPDDKMLEIALNSLKLALEAEENFKKTNNVL